MRRFVGQHQRRQSSSLINIDDSEQQWFHDWHRLGQCRMSPVCGSVMLPMLEWVLVLLVWHLSTLSTWATLESVLITVPHSSPSSARNTNTFIINSTSSSISDLQWDTWSTWSESEDTCAGGDQDQVSGETWYDHMRSDTSWSVRLWCWPCDHIQCQSILSQIRVKQSNMDKLGCKTVSA